MASFWYGIILLTEVFKNTKTYQDIRGQKMVRLSFFTKKNLTKLTASSPHKMYSQLLVFNVLIIGHFKSTKTMRGNRWSEHSFFA